MTLGERIIFYRKQRGLSQKALAELLGISATRLNYWEKNKREPDVQMINNLCEALLIDGDSLLGRERKTPPDPEGTRDEQEEMFISLFSKLTEEHKKFLVAVMQVLLAQD